MTDRRSIGGSRIQRRHGNHWRMHGESNEKPMSWRGKEAQEEIEEHEELNFSN